MKKKSIWAIVVIAIVVVLAIVAAYFIARPKAPAQPTVKPTIKVGYLPIVDHMTLMIADSKKMFTDENIELVKFSDLATLADAVASGKVDGAHMPNSLAMLTVSKGFQGKTVLLSNRGSIALAVDKSINSVQDLKGKTIAVPSHFSQHYFMLYNYLTENGIDPKKDVTIVDVAPPDFVSTLQSGSTQAFCGSEPFPTLAEAKGVGKKLAIWSQMEIPGVNGLGSVVVFSNDTIAKYPEAVQDYVKTIVEAGQYIEANPNEAATLASPYLSNIDPTILEKAKSESAYDNLYPKVGELKTLQDFIVKTGALKQGIDLDSFVVDSFAKQAYKDLGLTIPN